MFNNASESITCGNAACRAGETRKCVEGLEVSVCPNYGKPRVQAAIVEQGADENVSMTSLIALPSAQRLSNSAAASLLKRLKSRVVAIIGPHDAGKTSLIAGLYDLFQQGAVGGVEFAGSSTLHAFESACHYARAASRRATPHIDRTPLGGVAFYHLDVRGSEVASDGITIILGDRAGEEYAEAKNNVAVANQFHEVMRADVITIIADGERLLDSGERHNVTADITLIVQALVDAEVVSEAHRVALVLTKLDAVQASQHGERAIRDFEALVNRLRSNFAKDFACIEPFKIAASPKSAGVDRGAGIPQLLNFWLESPEVRWPANSVSVTPTRAIGRVTIRED